MYTDEKREEWYLRNENPTWQQLEIIVDFSNFETADEIDRNKSPKFNVSSIQHRST